MNNRLPTPLRFVSALLLPLHVLTLPAVQVWAAAPSEVTIATVQTALPNPPVLERQQPDLPSPTTEETTSPTPFRFSAEPGDTEFLHCRMFMEPLIPIGGKSKAEENQRLAAALQAFAKNTVTENTGALESFLETHPDSCWQVSLRTNLGLLYRRSGYWSKALANWRQAWQFGRGAQERLHTMTADVALAYLAELLARLGRVDELEKLIREAEGRDVRGAATEKFAAAKESLHLMKTEPQKAYRCGPMAVGSIFSALHPQQAMPMAVHESVCTSKGTSFEQVQEFAKKLGLETQVARRIAGAAVIVPSVVHWKEGHFAALVAKTDGRFVVKDPTFTDTIAMTLEAIEQESSGMFLVPAGPLPGGWSAVSPEDAANVWGKGQVPPNPEPPPPCTGPTIHCETCLSDGRGSGGGGGASAGGAMGGGLGGPGRYQLAMAEYNVDPVRVNLTIRDVPISYALPRGGSMEVAVHYSARDVAPGTTPLYPHLGPKWNVNLVTCIVDDPANDPNHVTTYTYGPGGGKLKYTGYIGTSTSGTFAPQQLNQSVLTCLSATSYERTFPDGSRQVFGLADTSSPRRVFLTEAYDPAGNKTTYNYNANFRLSSITDPLGQPVNFTYVSDVISDVEKYYRIKTISSLGRTATFTYYDEAGTIGRLWKITDPVGIVSEFTYGTGDFITQMTTPYGTTQFVQNDVEPNRMLTVIDPAGDSERIEFRYEDELAVPDIGAQLPSDPDLLIADYTNWKNRNTYYWDKKAFAENPQDTRKAKLMHWLHSTTLGETIDILESEKKPLENRVFYNYPGQTDARIAGTSNKPTKIARVMDDGKTQLSQFEYNAQGMVTKMVTPSDATATPPVPARTTTYQYAANGTDVLAAYQQRAGGQSTDPFGQPADLLMSATYNALHLPLTTTDAAGQTTTFTYNSYGQIKTVTNAKNETTTFAYDRDDDNNMESDGYLLSVTGPVAGAVTGFEYDGFNRLWKVTDSENYTVAITYDAIGGVNSATLNRPARITYPDGTTEESYYRYLDVEWTKDRQGRWTHNLYDALRRLVATHDPLGRVTQFAWCGCGALEGLIDPAGHATTWIRDLQGRVTEKVYDDGSTVAYTYQPKSGRLETVTDPRGKTTLYEYNIDNTVKKVSYPNAMTLAPAVATPEVEYAYETAYARLSTVTVGGAEVTTHGYNPITVPAALGAGRLASIDGPLADDTLAYTYDELGRVLNRTLNGAANSVTAAYDALGRVSSVSNALGSFTTAYVGVTGQLDYVDYPNQQRVDFDYYPNVPTAGGTGNGDRRLKQIRNLGVGAGGSGTVISQFDYEYNPAGQITGWTQGHSGLAQAQKWTLGYDAADQLVWGTLKNAVTGAVVSQAGFGFDPAGNRSVEQTDQSPKSASYNALNQLTSVSSATEMIVRGTVNEAATVTVGGKAATLHGGGEFSAKVPVTAGTNNNLEIRAKDASGNETVKNIAVNPATAGTTSLGYDANGNTLTISGGGAQERTFVWDSADRLVEVQYPGTTKKTKISYDGLRRWTRVVEEDNAVTTADRRFVWEGMALAEERDASNAVVKRFYAQGEQRGAANYYYLRDHLGSVREVTDTSGVLKARYDYTLWGDRTKLAGDPNFECDFGFTGHLLHAQSGMHFAPMRQYEGKLGRWVSRDPIEESDGPNLYAYVHNNPVLLFDPLGLCDQRDPRGVPKCREECLKFWDDWEEQQLNRLRWIRRVSSLNYALCARNAPSVAMRQRVAGLMMAAVRDIERMESEIKKRVEEERVKCRALAN